MNFSPLELSLVLLGLLAVFIIDSIKSERTLRGNANNRLQAIPLEDHSFRDLNQMDYVKLGGATLAAKSQAATHNLKDHPDAEFRIIGAASSVIGFLSGEELRLFQTTLNKPLSRFNESTIDFLKRDRVSRLEIYSLVSEYVHNVISRATPIEEDRGEENLKEFIIDLQSCSDALRDGDPGTARKIANRWNRYWKTNNLDKGILPKDYLFLAIQGVKAIRSIYGDTFEWIERQHHIQEIERTKQLLDHLLIALKKKDKFQLFSVATEFVNRPSIKWV